MPAMSAPHYLFLTTSTREPGHLGNTEWLARQAAASLPAGTEQTWHHLARMQLPPFVDQRHTTGTYAPPEGDMKTPAGRHAGRQPHRVGGAGVLVQHPLAAQDLP